MGTGLGHRVTTLRTLTQRLNGLFEIIEGIELTIDGGEAQVCDDVQIAQKRENRLSDLVRRHVGDTRRAQLLLHLLSKNCKLIIRHRPTLAGLFHSRHHLVTGEGLNHTGALDNLE